MIVKNWLQMAVLGRLGKFLWNIVTLLEDFTLCHQILVEFCHFLLLMYYICLNIEIEVHTVFICPTEGRGAKNQKDQFHKLFYLLTLVLTLKNLNFPQNQRYWGLYTTPKTLFCLISFKSHQRNLIVYYRFM